ncbi:MAG: sensor histidine kinase [Anaerolineales bacterium]
MSTAQRNPGLFYAFGSVFILAVSARSLGFYFLEAHGLRWIAAILLAAFALLYSTERLISRWFAGYLHLYLALQTVLALVILMLPPQHFFSAGLGLVLSGQAVLLLPGRQAYAWIGAFIGVMLFGLVWGQGLLNGLTLGLLFIGGYLFTGAYAGAVGRATAAQHRSEALLSDLQEAHEQLRMYAAQAEQLAVVEERQRMARDLHDSAIQALYGLVLSSEGAARKLAEGKVELVGERLQEIRRTAHAALHEMRSLIFELRPPDLEKEGLLAALRSRLEAVEDRAGVRTSLKVEGDGRLSHNLEAGLYRVVQEALNNALKHSGAEQVTVSLNIGPELVALEVADDGIGFDSQAAHSGGGLGLRGMVERAQELGGKLSLQSEPGQGTRIRLEVPK